MVLNNTYTTYDNVSFILPLVLLILSPPTLVLIWQLNAICCAYVWRKYNFQQWNIVVNMLKQIYGDYLEDCNGDNNSEDQYKLYSIEISRHKVTLLFTGVIGIYCCAAISFWSDLIVEETTQCDVKMDCFALNTSTGIPVQEMPRWMNVSTMKMMATLYNALDLSSTI